MSDLCGRRPKEGPINRLELINSPAPAHTPLLRHQGDYYRDGGPHYRQVFFSNPLLILSIGYCLDVVKPSFLAGRSQSVMYYICAHKYSNDSSLHNYIELMIYVKFKIWF